MMSHGFSQITLAGAALQMLSAALRHCALENLQMVSLLRCAIGNRLFCDFLDALGQSDCALIVGRGEKGGEVGGGVGWGLLFLLFLFFLCLTCQ